MEETKPETKKRTRRAITPSTALANTIATLEKLRPAERLQLLKAVTAWFEAMQTEGV